MLESNNLNSIQSLQRIESNNISDSNISLKNKDSLKLCSSESNPYLSHLSNFTIYNIDRSLMGRKIDLYSALKIDITREPWLGIITSALEIDCMEIADSSIIFVFDVEKKIPKGFHFEDEEYKEHLQHSVMRYVDTSITLNYMNRVGYDKLQDFFPKKTLKFSKSLPEFPPNSAFSVEIDIYNKQAKLSMYQNPSVSTRILHNVMVEKMPKAYVSINTDNIKESIMPAGMCHCVYSSLEEGIPCHFVSTSGLGDCTAVIFFDRKKKSASLTHYWTQTINSFLLNTQIDTMRSNGSCIDDIEATVVGGYRGNLFSASGFFNSILPFMKEKNLYIKEVNVGDCRPKDIIFDIRSGNVYKMKLGKEISMWHPLDSLSPINKGSIIEMDSEHLKKNGVTSSRSYFFSDNKNPTNITHASVTLP